LLEQYLPPKTEYVLLCNPTPTQASIYRLVLQTSMFQCALGNAESALQLITILKKLCNSPSLLALNQDDTKQGASALATLSEFLPPGFSRHFTPGASGKIRVLDQLLHTMSSTTDEKIVLVSNYTSTLDALAVLLASLSLPFLRLDGSTPPSKRQSLVDEFNRSSARSCFAFLLSAKAGGTGLNLIGASRLVLFDVDWNPATDLQAMARIHRDGQTRHCRIYRFVLKGSLEEKIWQRQITKVGLADSVMDQRAGVSAFSREELRDLFRLDEGEECQTHELLGCACGGLGGEASQEMEGVGGGEGDHTDEDSEDEEDVACLVKASELSPDQIKQPLSRRTRRREAGQKQLLMQYQHIHPERLMKRTAETALRHDRETTTAGDEAVTQACATHPQLEQLIDDDMLVTLLKEHASGVGFLFKKDGGSALEPAAAMSVSA
ncbi:helicase, partial [Ascosphaera acerosa]